MTVDIWGWVYWFSRFLYVIFQGIILAISVYVYYKAKEKDGYPWRGVLSVALVLVFVDMTGKYKDYPITRAKFEATKVSAVLRVGDDFLLTTSDGLTVTRPRGFRFGIKNGYLLRNIPKPEMGTCVELQFADTGYPFSEESSGWVAYVYEISITPSSCAKLATKKEFLSALDLYKERALLWEKSLADARSRLTEDELEDYLRSTYEGK